MSETAISAYNGILQRAGMDVATADIDGDNNIDIVVASMKKQEISWYQNIYGDGSNFIRGDVDGGLGEPVSVFVEDVDGDTVPDVVSAATTSGSEIVNLYKTVRTPSADDDEIFITFTTHTIADEYSELYDDDDTGRTYTAVKGVKVFVADLKLNAEATQPRESTFNFVSAASVDAQKFRELDKFLFVNWREACPAAGRRHSRHAKFCTTRASASASRSTRRP